MYQSHTRKTITFVVILILGALAVGLGWQCQCIKQAASHVKSGTVGLDRRVTLYANDGSIIQEWEGKFMIEDSGASIRFLLYGDAITVAGTYVVEENPKPRKRQWSWEKRKEKKEGP